MQIVVLSCDKNQDTFEPFHHCLEKYWPNHPKVTYFTELVGNPYYPTICANYPLNKWTVRLRKSLEYINDEQILVIVDDCFIRRPVDEKRVADACKALTGNVALVNFELSFDDKDEDIGISGFKKRQHGSSYEVSIMCGLWNKQKLMKVLEPESDPWGVEFGQNNCGFDYLINSGDYIIDWGYKTWHLAGICKGKWCREVVPFFESEGIKVDYSKRGFRG